MCGLGPTEEQASTSALEILQAVGAEVMWVRKRSLSAFFATDLSVELSRLTRNQIIVTGVFAAAGITATTYDALANDIRCFVVADATADYSYARHAAALRHITSTTAAVVTADIVVTPGLQHSP